MEICNWREPKNILTLLGITFVFLLLMTALLREALIRQPWQISVQGNGEVEYTADQATIYLGIKVEKSETAKEALDELNESMNDAVDAIKKLGVEEKDIHTERYNLYTRYDYISGKSILAGYNANQQLRIKIEGIQEDRDKVAQVISAAAEAGVNQINNVEFEPSNLAELREEARLIAIKDAREKADGMADALGVELVKVIGWWEDSQYPQPRYYGEMGMGGGGGGGPVLPEGKDVVRVNVSLNYLLK